MNEFGAMMFDVGSLRKYGEARDDDNLCSRAADEIERLRAALTEIAGDPTGVSSYQAELAKQALGLPSEFDVQQKEGDK